MLHLADQKISRDHALNHLVNYARAVPDTIRYFDFCGGTEPPQASDGVEMADIARLVVINAELRAGDIHSLLTPVDAHLWVDVPHEARFEDLPDNPLDHPTYQALLALYNTYNCRHGLGATKVTKMLHLKRPLLVPILDSVALRAYETKAKEVALEFGRGLALHWPAMWRDARHNAADIQDLKAQLSTTPATADLALLAPLRLHDVLVWSHFRDPNGCPLAP